MSKAKRTLKKVFKKDNDSFQPSLSSRQKELLEFIKNTLGREQHLPSYREMAKALGVHAVGTIQDHLKALEEKGFIERDSGRVRLTRLSEHCQVPVLGEVAAGSLHEAIENSLGTLSLSLKNIPSTRTQNLFALKVRGDSMVDAGIVAGDYVVVDSKAQIADGAIGVVLYDGEATVKELRFLKGGRLKLIPHNQKLKPYEVPLDATCKILGKVVALQRFF